MQNKHSTLSSVEHHNYFDFTILFVTYVDVYLFKEIQYLTQIATASN